VGKKYLDPRVCHARGCPKAPKKKCHLGEMLRRGKRKKNKIMKN